MFSNVLLFCRSPTNSSVNTHNIQCITLVFVLAQSIFCIPPNALWWLAMQTYSHRMISDSFRTLNDVVNQNASSCEKFNPPMRNEAFYVCHKRDYIFSLNWLLVYNVRTKQSTWGLIVRIPFSSRDLSIGTPFGVSVMILNNLFQNICSFLENILDAYSTEGLQTSFTTL